VELEAGDRQRVAPIEALGEAQHRRQRPHGPPQAPRQTAEAFMLALRRRLAVITRDQGDHLDLVRLEAAQIAVRDQVVRVLVVALVRDVNADIVEQRGIFQPLALAIGEGVNAARLFEERDGDLRHLAGVLRPVVAALRQLDHAAPPHGGIAIRLRDLLAVAVDDEGGRVWWRSR